MLHTNSPWLLVAVSHEIVITLRRGRTRDDGDEEEAAAASADASAADDDELFATPSAVVAEEAAGVAAAAAAEGGTDVVSKQTGLVYNKREKLPGLTRT
jgi:hypothetical protein